MNTGLRIGPSAGSASGVLPNPVGYNRVYVALRSTPAADRAATVRLAENQQPGRSGGESDSKPALTYDAWWDGIRAGRCFVTNGPLLICRANGEFPGHVFSYSGGSLSSNGGRVKIDIDMELISNDSVPAIEIIQDGQVVQTIRCNPDVIAQEITGHVSFGQSGWFLVRAIAENSQTFRFASTAPFYVEIGPTKRRISRKSAALFRNWVDDRIKRVELDDTTQLRDVLKYHHLAHDFWTRRVEAANAE